jgi:hypothetical protein
MTNPPPSSDAFLAAMAALNLRLAETVTVLGDIERRTGEELAKLLPAPDALAPTTHEASMVAAHGVDATDSALANAVPRVAALARAFDGLSRTMRQTVWLRERFAAGWPRRAPAGPAGPAAADDRTGMVRRQVAHEVGAALRGAASGEAAAERLGRDLAERLDDPAFEARVEQQAPQAIIAELCDDLLGLAAQLRQPGLPPPKPRPAGEIRKHLAERAFWLAQPPPDD